MGESIYLGIMIYVSNISLIITNIKLMYKNTLRNTSWGATVRESATPPSTPNKIFWMKPCKHNQSIHTLWVRHLLSAPYTISECVFPVHMRVPCIQISLMHVATILIVPY